MHLHLVRHGPPAIHRQAPASTWELDPGGFGEIDRLGAADVLPSAAATLWFSSTEPKAMQTSRRLAGADLEIVALGDVREAGRPADGMTREEFADTVVRSVEHSGVPARQGWETTASVRARMLRTLREDVARRVGEAGSDSVDVVLVGHGTAWTVLVAALTHQPPDLSAWRSMRMPDHCLLDVSLGSGVEGDGERDDPATMSWPGTGRVVTSWGSWVHG